MSCFSRLTFVKWQSGLWWMWTKDDKMYEGRLSCFLTKINDVDSGGHLLPHLVLQWLSIAGWVMAGAVIRVISACLKCSQAWRRDAMLQKKYWRNIREALLLGRCACTWSVSLVRCALPWWNLTWCSGLGAPQYSPREYSRWLVGFLSLYKHRQAESLISHIAVFHKVFNYRQKAGKSQLKLAKLVSCFFSQIGFKVFK